jgi:hypothetical protein
MRMPTHMPSRPSQIGGPNYIHVALSSALMQQGDPLKCGLCCSGKAGFVACLARCIATGQACDGGLNNCTSCG